MIWIYLYIINRSSLFRPKTTALKALNHTIYSYASTIGGHTWQVWRKNLHDFAPLLFR